MRCKAAFRAAVAFAVITSLVAATEAPASALPGDGIVSDYVGNKISAAFSATTTGVVTWVLDAVGVFADGILNFLKTSARPQLDAVWFSGPTSPYASVRNIAVLLLLGLIFLGVISGLIRGDITGMIARIAAVLPAAVAGMLLTTVVVGQLLDLTDALSTAVLDNSGDQAIHFLSGFGATATATTNGFAALVIGMFAVGAAFALWVELIIRSSLIYFLVALSPLAFASTLWPATRGILRRLIELLLAAILSKLVICIALSIGVAALSGAGTAALPDAGLGVTASMSLGSLLTGTTLLVLAAWSPFLLMRMIPFVEGAVVAQGVSHSPARATQSAIGTASSAGSATRLAGVTSTSGGGSHHSRLANKQPSPRLASVDRLRPRSKRNDRHAQ